MYLYKSIQQNQKTDSNQTAYNFFMFGLDVSLPKSQT